MSSFHVIIPARYGSTRLPGKPLAEIDGQPMIQHVVACAQRSSATTVTVATDDERIERVVREFGGEVMMTSDQHVSGTDRIAEAVEKLALSDEQVIVNVQGDEPEMPAALIDQVADLLISRPHAVMATASAPLDSAAQLDDPAVVKVVSDCDGNALYFSRTAIAQTRERESATDTSWIARRHLGIYAYRCGYLRQFAARPACALEQHEQLEQLRVLWYGEKIACAEAVEVPTCGIDTAEDLVRIRKTRADHSHMA